MASLQVGSGQVSQRVDPGLVDPRLLGADMSRIGQGIGQGMGMANDYYTAKENASMRPIRRGLMDMQLASAQEQMLLASDRRALSGLQVASLQEHMNGAVNRNRMADLALQDAQLKADISASTPTVIDKLGKYVKGGEAKGGYWSAPDNRNIPVSYTDQEAGEVQQVRLPSGKIVTRNMADYVLAGKDVAIKMADRANKQANELDRLGVLHDKVDVMRQRYDVARESGVARAKDVDPIRYNLKDGGIALGYFNKATNEWVVPPKRLPESGATDSFGNMINAAEGKEFKSLLPTYDFGYPVPAQEPTALKPNKPRGVFDWFSRGSDGSKPATTQKAKPVEYAPSANEAHFIGTSPAAVAKPVDEAELSAAIARIRSGSGLDLPVTEISPKQIYSAKQEAIMELGKPGADIKQVKKRLNDIKLWEDDSVKRQQAERIKATERANAIDRLSGIADGTSGISAPLF